MDMYYLVGSKVTIISSMSFFPIVSNVIVIGPYISLIFGFFTKSVVALIGVYNIVRESSIDRWVIKINQIIDKIWKSIG